MKGKLYIVATPIGNLADITLRALDVLKDVSFILAEDTRQSQKLLAKYDIGTPLVSYRDQNHKRILPKILEKLDAGLDLALVSDAGTPLISDPGYKLVKSLKQSGYEVLPVPGPDSVTAALSASGLPTDKYIFLGFLPKSGKKRDEILSRYLDLDCTVVVFESPNRLLKLLELLSLNYGGRRIAVAKDITKLHEKIFVGYAKDAILEFESGPKGEFVVLIGKE